MNDRLKEIIEWVDGGQSSANCWGGHRSTLRSCCEGIILDYNPY